MEEVDRILGTDLPEIDKLLQSFNQITGTILEHGRGEVDLLRALGDEEGLVKVQVKLSTVEHCRSVLQQCYQLIAARRAADGETTL